MKPRALDSDRPRIGALRGLQACSRDGRFAILALDHRQNLRSELRPDDPGSVSSDEIVDFKRAVTRHLAILSTGILLDPEIGAPRLVAEDVIPGQVGLLVALEETGYEGSSTNRVSRIVDGWSVAKAKRMGASAAKILIYYNPDVAGARLQERLVADVALACRRADLSLFVEAISFSATGGRLVGEERRRTVIETARRLTALGGDVLKAEFPYDPGTQDEGLWLDACAELTATSRLPWVLLSGGVDYETFERQAAVACRAGASGVLAGRAIWAEAATGTPSERDSFLSVEAAHRFSRLRAVVDELARPWRAVDFPLARLPQPSEGWHRMYQD